jgi:hypothetical protein
VAPPGRVHLTSPPKVIGGLFVALGALRVFSGENARTWTLSD